MSKSGPGTLAVKFLQKTVKEITDDGGNYPETMMLLEAVILGVMMINTQIFRVPPHVSVGLAEAALHRATEKFVTEMNKS